MANVPLQQPGEKGCAQMAVPYLLLGRFGWCSCLLPGQRYVFGRLSRTCACFKYLRTAVWSSAEEVISCCAAEHARLTCK
jgi:hypothetical protein